MSPEQADDRDRRQVAAIRAELNRIIATSLIGCTVRKQAEYLQKIMDDAA